MSNERRKRTRIEAAFDVWVSVRRKKIKLETLNISMTGILCTANPSLKENEACRITIDLGTKAKIAAEGKIIRSDVNDAAIAFTSMSESSFANLKKLIQFNFGDADRINKELRYPAFMERSES